MLVPRSVDKVLQVGLICASQFCRQESPPAWSKSGFPFEKNFTCKSANLVQCSWRHVVVQKNRVTATDEILNLRLELVVD